MNLNRVLFIPVSSPSGIGEYMRSMIIAKALQVRWPNIDIHFILNEQVSYFKDCPYTVHGCKHSPTKDVITVNRIIEKISPSLVVFDASGRAQQFKKAKEVGAKVAFISQHHKKRSRGLKLNRLFNIDIHWVAQPDFCIKPINCWQRAKLALFNKKSPKNIGPVFEFSHHDDQDKILAQFNLVRGQYFIFNAGSGGHLVENKLAADIFYQAAQAFHQQTGIKSMVLFGDNYPKNLPKSSEIHCLKSIGNKEFIGLIAAAQACVISAGDTLLQCIAIHKACVAAPVSPDQPVRLKICQNQKLVLGAKPTIDGLLQQALLLTDQQQRKVITSNMENTSPVNALGCIVDDITALFPLEHKENVKGENK